MACCSFHQLIFCFCTSYRKSFTFHTIKILHEQNIIDNSSQWSVCFQLVSLCIAGKPLSCLDFCSLFGPSVNQRRGRHGRHGLSLRCRVSRPDQAVGDVHIYVRSAVAFWISLPGCLNHRNNNRKRKKRGKLDPRGGRVFFPYNKNEKVAPSETNVRARHWTQ